MTANTNECKKCGGQLQKVKGSDRKTTYQSIGEIQHYYLRKCRRCGQHYTTKRTMKMKENDQ